MHKKFGHGEDFFSLAFILFAAATLSAVGAFQDKGGQAASPKPGDTKVNSKDGLRYRWIPPGNFTSGCSPHDKDCYKDEFPNRKIILTKGFWLGETEVTQAAYERVTGDNPSVFQGADLPVEMITWNAADSYCREIGDGYNGSGMGSNAPARGHNGAPLWRFRSDRLVLEEQQVFHSPGRAEETQRVQVYDMLGNVVEWTHTWYTVQISQENINPTGPSSAEFKSPGWRRLRDDPDLVRASYRSRIEPGDTDYNIGFRCVSEFRPGGLTPVF